MTKAELTARVAELEELLQEAAEQLKVLRALNAPRIATNDPGSPVCISFKGRCQGVLVYEDGATLFTDTETVGAVGNIPADVLLEEIKWARR